MVKPSIFEVHFFPNSSEEMHLINLISKTKISLDIAMFTINNIHIAEEIKKIFYKGIKLRIITDGECIKMPSSNIYSLAAIGINIKTDDSVRYHMHHKFCVIDNSVVVTGSFNWTDQAVNHNQENLLFLENKDLAIKYSNEFQKLWDDFVIVITKEKALSKIKEDEEKKMAAESRKRREKEKKLIEKENKKKEINEMEIDSYDNCYNKSFSKKKRNRYENKGFEQNNNDNNDKDTNDENNNNINDKQESKGSNCFIF
jgi:phosphatidylserine/phosphatidylglycerophosphate/cardiolipin synthase-like enzyme